MSELEKLLPPHKAGMTICHNDHKGYYQSVVDWISENEMYDWPSEQEKQKAIETDSVWTMQCYPNTPVGFFAVAAATLDELLKISKE